MKHLTLTSLALVGLLAVSCSLIDPARAAQPQISLAGEAEINDSHASADTASAIANQDTEDQSRGSAAEDPLVETSKRAIIETGISESYFERHFKLIKAVNEPEDRRVEWSYSVNEYQTQLVDAIGFHTTGGKRTYVHGIKNQLFSTHEIVKTLPRQRARNILRSCIGEFEGESMTYRALTVPGKARLYLTGRSRIIKEQSGKGKQRGQTGPRFFYVGFVDVESGKCVKKLAKVPS